MPANISLVWYRAPSNFSKGETSIGWMIGLEGTNYIAAVAY